MIDFVNCINTGAAALQAEVEHRGVRLGGEVLAAERRRRV